MRHRFTARRRDVLRAGLLGGVGVAAGEARAADRQVVIVADANDPIIAAAPVQWALGDLRAALSRAGATVRDVQTVGDVGDSALALVVSGAGAPVAVGALRRAGIRIGEGPERLALFSPRIGGARVKMACGSDAVGLMYALQEIVDRLETGSGIGEALALRTPITEAPYTPVRSIMRQFVSESLDKDWYNDREMWSAYLGMLAKQRFNQFHLAFGLGYDTLRGVTDSYLLFLYPFLVDVPGYDVRVTNYSPAEREANLATLRYISEQSVARGVAFQLGIWTHGYELIESPDARYHVEGLTAETHAAYCRDALTALLQACPAISSVAIRFHGESGVAEGNYGFWRTVYEGVARCGRTVEIDLHAKGVDEPMIARAMETGMPVTVSEKCWAEHHGMTYHQADIRPSERPAPGQVGRGLLSLSEGSLSFTRYGYADLMRENRAYKVRHRVFAGTQRILLSGDPAWTPVYAERFTFCGSDGFDLMEPLTARGRRGTGISGTRRSGYVDAALEPRYDWEKYAYWYRVWGRLSYNRDSDPSVWRRAFGAGERANAMVSALARASRILPIVTTAHSASAACDAYWPEIYWNHSLVVEPAGNLLWDSPAPKTFQNVTPHDPQLFTTIDACAAEWLSGEHSGKYTPINVAQWLDGLAASVEADLVAAGEPETIESRRLIIDTHIQAGLGRFFAAKFRAGVLFAIFERTRDGRALIEAISQYRLARSAWAQLSERASVYADDLSVSDKYSERLHWRAQLPSIDEDIARLEALASSAGADDANVSTLIASALGGPSPFAPVLTHTPPATFTRGQDVSVSVAVPPNVQSVRLFYRRVNQAKRWEETAMRAAGRTHRAAIPAAYTDTVYPLQYYFVAAEGPAKAALYPGVGGDLTNEPYFVVRQA